MRCRLGLGDVLIKTIPHPVEECLGNVGEVGHDASIEMRLLFSWRHRFQFSCSHDVSTHRLMVPDADTSIGRHTTSSQELDPSKSPVGATLSFVASLSKCIGDS